MDEETVTSTSKKVKQYKGSAAAAKRVSELPRATFGKGRGWRTRRAVLMAIALSADPDGTGAEPGYALISLRGCVSERTAHLTVNRLRDEGLITVSFKAGKHGTNCYTINFPSEKTTEHPASIVAGSDPASCASDPASCASDPASCEPDPASIVAPNLSINPKETERETESAPTAPLSSETKATAPAKRPENGQSEARLLFAKLANHSSTEWIIPTPKLKKAVNEVLAEGYSTEDVHTAILNIQTDENDGLSWRIGQLADGLPSRLDALRDSREQQARNDESVRIQEEVARQQAVREAEQRANREMEEFNQAQEILAMLPEAPVEVTA